MVRFSFRLIALCTAAGAALLAAAPVQAQTRRANIVPADIEAATYSGSGQLPGGQSALTAKVQILLDRSGVSPGVVDGFRGGMSESAIAAFERKHGLAQDGQLDPQVWAMLQQVAAGPTTSTYTVTPQDAEGLVDAIPSDYAQKAAMSAMGYVSIAEKLAERFHMDEKFLVQLNPGVKIAPGAVLAITLPAEPIKAKVARIVVDKASGRVAAYDGAGVMVADYPATVGSADTPSPHGSHLVEAVALDPNYTYNPNVNFKQGQNDKVLTIPPGPNAPVGNVWIDLSQPTYGIHGTPTPSKLFVNESHGCVRLTNWDARELAKMVQPGKTIVDFLAPGVAIADVTRPVPAASVPAVSLPAGGPQSAAAPQGTRPPARGRASAVATTAPQGQVPPVAGAAMPAAGAADALDAALQQATGAPLTTNGYALPAPGTPARTP